MTLSLLDLLRGCWSIDRRIEPGGHFTGIATFTDHAADSLLYQESGDLMLENGTVLQGQNSYLYTLHEGKIDISFTNGLSKGGHFIGIYLPAEQPWNLPIVSVDRHHCRRDTYDATFRIEAHTLFTITYVVNGPEKHYVIHSVYRRTSSKTSCTAATCAMTLPGSASSRVGK